MEVASRLQGIGEYYFSQKPREVDQLNKAGKNIINLGIGSPDRPPHPDVIKVLQEESARPDVHAYQSYKGSPVLRNAISKWYDTWYGVALNPDTEILPLIGSKEGLVHIAMTYFDSNTGVLVPNPGYPTYRSAVKLASAYPHDYYLQQKNNWRPDIEELYRQVDESGDAIKAIIVNYPHMPTGTRADIGLFTELVSFAREKQLLLIHDNPYSFILNDKPISLLSIDGARSCVIELNSLSKSHNMAGWRVGMLCGAETRINDVLRFKSNMDSGMFLPVQLAAAKALTLGREWYDEVNQTYFKRREKVYSLLDAIGCTYSREQSGLFVWAAVPAGYKDGYVLADELLYNAGVFITPGGIFGDGGNQYIRVSLCSTEEKITESVQRIQSAIKA